MMAATFQDIPSAIITAGISAIRGHTYGMNSMIPPMSASVKVFSREKSKIASTVRSPIYVIENILIESMSIPRIHDVNTCCI